MNLDAVGEYKMVLVVRQDLGMGKGKVAAQVGQQQYNTAVIFFTFRVHIHIKYQIIGNLLEICGNPAGFLGNHLDLQYDYTVLSAEKPDSFM